MDVKCPHCEKAIELVGSTEIEREFGLNSNQIQYRQRRQEFPEPWLKFGNRTIWLKRDIESLEAERRKRELDEATNKVREALASVTLTDEERQLLLKQITDGQGKRSRARSA